MLQIDCRRGQQLDLVQHRDCRPPARPQAKPPARPSAAPPPPQPARPPTNHAGVCTKKCQRCGLGCHGNHFRGNFPARSKPTSTRQGRRDVRKSVCRLATGKRARQPPNTLPLSISRACERRHMSGIRWVLRSDSTPLPPWLRGVASGSPRLPGPSLIGGPCAGGRLAVSTLQAAVTGLAWACHE